MLKILQQYVGEFSNRLQQYVNRELPDVQVGFRKGRRTRDQIAKIGSEVKASASNAGDLGLIPG